LRVWTNLSAYFAAAENFKSPATPTEVSSDEQIVKAERLQPVQETLVAVVQPGRLLILNFTLECASVEFDPQQNLEKIQR